MADPIPIFADLELADAVMLRAKGDKIGNRRLITALDISAHELAALGETEGVDSGGVAQLWVSGDVGTYLLNLLGQVSEEGGSAVRGGVGGETDEVSESAGIDFAGEITDGSETFGFVAGGH